MIVFWIALVESVISLISIGYIHISLYIYRERELGIPQDIDAQVHS